MRLIQMLSNNELREHILVLYENLKPYNGDCQLDICFDENNLNSEGLFVFSNHQGYHYLYSERGEETTHKVTDDIFEISFWIFQPVTSSIAFEFAAKNIEQKKSRRQIAFEKQLEYLDILGENFRKRGEIEIDEILKVYPY